MLKDRIVLLYLLMLLAHLAHVFEEIWGGFIAINVLGSLGRFLALNWVLFCIPIVIFYFILREKRWAYYAGMFYAAIMILNGLGHNIMTIATGKCFGGFAGGFSGIALIIFGFFLLHVLWKGRPPSRIT
ncbi:hypothetical protein KKG05_03695 [bacterium]|nr:hypothetical protein [bacterium]